MTVKELSLQEKQETLQKIYDTEFGYVFIDVKGIIADVTDDGNGVYDGYSVEEALGDMDILGLDVELDVEKLALRTCNMPCYDDIIVPYNFNMSYEENLENFTETVKEKYAELVWAYVTDTIDVKNSY